MARSNQKVVLITGASSGIGQAIAQKLTQQGLNVLGTSRLIHATGETVPEENRELFVLQKEN